MQIKNRSETFKAVDYRFGFNGKYVENTLSEGNLDFGDRIYSSKIGKWLGVDKALDIYVALSTYHFGANNPINIGDLDGNILRDANGNIIVTSNGTKTTSNGTNFNPSTGLGVKKFNKYEKVTVYADDGTEITAYRYIETVTQTFTEVTDQAGNTQIQVTTSTAKENGPVSDCHGQTFLDGKLWLDDTEVKKLIDHDGYDQNLKESSASAVVMTKSGSVVHSATRETDGTYTADAGILETKTNLTLEQSAGSGWGTGQLTDVSNPNNLNFISKRNDDINLQVYGNLNNTSGLHYLRKSDVPPADVLKQGQEAVDQYYSQLMLQRLWDELPDVEQDVLRPENW